MGENVDNAGAHGEKTLQDEICRLIQEAKFCFADTIYEREEDSSKKLNEEEFSGMHRNCLKKSRKKIKDTTRLKRQS